MFRLIALACLWISASAAHAATLSLTDQIQTDPAAGCSIRLDGQILPGDAGKLDQTLSALIARTDNYPSPHINAQIVLCFASPGGSFTEAIEMAALIYDRAVTTRVAPGASCLSACALAFMGGNLNTRSGEGWRPSRFLHPTSRLGFHAPALVLPEGEFTRRDVERAYAVAIAAVGLISRDAPKLRIPQELLTQIFSNVGDSFHYVDRVDHLSGYGISLYGYDVPPLGPETSKTACRNGWRWYAGLWKSHRPAARLTDWTAGYRSLANGMIEFFPFDGVMFCRHSLRALGGGDVDVVVQSEFQDLRNPRFERSYMPWIRYPGALPLTDIANGPIRDF